MVVSCEKCGVRYDDVYRLTYCPHDNFEMNTTVVVGGEVVGVAHSIEELERLMDSNRRTNSNREVVDGRVM